MYSSMSIATPMRCIYHVSNCSWMASRLCSSSCDPATQNQGGSVCLRAIYRLM
jgi:hypothetical protein